MRYVLTVILVVGAFGAALYLRSERPAPADATDLVVMDGLIVMDGRPEVRTQKVEGGMELHVHFCFAGTCSRAKVVYDHEGRERVLDATTNCQRSLGSASSGDLRGDGYLSEVELNGKLPDGATNVRLILESETGIRVAPVEF